MRVIIMTKKLINTYKGTIINKFLPEILENGQYLDEENIDIIGLEIKLPNNKIKIIKDRDSDYADLFVKDNVIVNEFACQYDYQGYLNALRDIIDDYYSAYSEDKRKLIFNKFYVTKEEYEKKPKAIINYEIVFNKEQNI